MDQMSMLSKIDATTTPLFCIETPPPPNVCATARENALISTMQEQDPRKPFGLSRAGYEAAAPR
jgi:hypothetical protein